MRKTTLIAGLLGLCLAGGTASAASITTLFAWNNGGSLGGAVYFDLTVASNDITITGFETNTAETVAFDFTVYLTAPGGTRVGNETTAGLWTVAATGSGVGQGFDVPSVVTLDSPFGLLANTTYGIALVMGSTAGHDYTNGNGSNQSYANSDLSLAFGSATNNPFSGGTNDPRVWNGTINYELGAPVPEPSTFTLLLFGAGLGLVAVRRRRNGNR